MLSFNIPERKVLERVCWAPFTYRFRILLTPYLLLKSLLVFCTSMVK